MYRYEGCFEGLRRGPWAPRRHHHHSAEGDWRGRPAHCREWRCGPGDKAPGMFRRRFISREERIAWLEQYLRELQNEAKAVEERIADLKAAE